MDLCDSTACFIQPKKKLSQIETISSQTQSPASEKPLPHKPCENRVDQNGVSCIFRNIFIEMMCGCFAETPTLFDLLQVVNKEREIVDQLIPDNKISTSAHNFSEKYAIAVFQKLRELLLSIRQKPLLNSKLLDMMTDIESKN